MVGSYIKGEEGTDVTVTVYRETTDEYLDFTMTRSNIETPTVEHEMLPDGIGYVLVTQFEGVTAGQFKAAVEDLEGQGMEKLIIDLRNNPGGLLDAAVEMAAYMLPDGTIVRTEYKNGKGDDYFSKDGKLMAETTGRNQAEPVSHGGRPRDGYPRGDPDQRKLRQRRGGVCGGHERP